MTNEFLLFLKANNDYINWQISRFRDEKVPTLIQNRAREAQFYTEYEIMNKGL